MLGWLKRAPRTESLDAAGIDAALAQSRQLQEAGDVDGAAALVDAVLAGHPRHARALTRLGTLRFIQGRLDDAQSLYGAALALEPQNADLHFNLALVHGGRGDAGRSIAGYRAALALKPDFHEAHFNLATVLHEIDDLEAAIASYEAAEKCTPGRREVLIGMGLARLELDQLDAAITCFDRILAMDPHYPEAHLYKAMAQLKRGEYAEGWDNYDHRFDTEEIRGARRDYPGPRWRGEALQGHTILLIAEQGFGDTIQFIRFAPLLVERGARVIVEAPAPLATLLGSMPGIRIVVAGAALPPYDFHSYLMSLPRFLARNLGAIPAVIPYLQPTPTKMAAWRERLAADSGFKVGLVWAGDPHKEHPSGYRADRRRSSSLGQLARLGEVAGVSWYSVQKGAAAAQAHAADAPFELVDTGPELHDFDDTAALLQALDLVVTVDTAVAHLAGALGRPVWVMLRYDCCWRWLKERNDSPWYPTARLYRQPRRFDWAAVAADVVRDLAPLAAGQTASVQ